MGVAGDVGQLSLLFYVTLYAFTLLERRDIWSVKNRCIYRQLFHSLTCMGGRPCLLQVDVVNSCYNGGSGGGVCV